MNAFAIGLLGLLAIGLALALWNQFNESQDVREKANLTVRIVKEQIEDFGQRLAGLEAGMAQGRANLQFLTDQGTGLRNALRDLEQIIGEALTELREQEKKRNEPPPDAWKAGEVALSRIDQHRRELRRLEDESLKQWIAEREAAEKA